MWVAFGLLTLLVSCGYAGIKRFEGDWRGLPGRLPGQRGPGADYLHRFTWGGRKRTLMQIGLPTRTALEFECKPESPLDRFFKWAGLSVEMQVGHDAFDRAVYLVSDDRRVLDMLRDDPVLRSELQFLFGPLVHADYRLVRLVCRGGKLRLDFKPRLELARSFALAEVVVPRLHALVARLPDQLLLDQPGRDPLFLRSVLVLAVSTGLMLHGGLHLFRLWLLPGAATIDAWPLVVLGVTVGAVLLGLLVLAAVLLLARSSRLHLVLLEVLLVGGIGAMATGIVEVRDLNMAFDRSPVAYVQVTVLDKSSHRKRRSSRVYRLSVSGIEGYERRRVRVGRRLYQDVAVGDVLVLRQRAGYLGLRWTEGFEPSGGPRPALR